MNSTVHLSLEDFRRLPGLYRRWELTEVCELNRHYQIEDAGTHADGTPLLAVYAAEPERPCPVPPEGCRSPGDAKPHSLGPAAPLVEQFIGQRKLADRWGISPRTLERWRRLGLGPNYIKLGLRVVYDLRDIRAFEADHLHVVRRKAAVHPGQGEQS